MTSFQSKRRMTEDKLKPHYSNTDNPVDFPKTESIMDKLMYESGLTADGSFGDMDQYDQEAIMRFAELIVRECAEVADLADENKCEWIGGNILTRFGVEE